MDKMFAPAPQHRRSPVGTAVSAVMHVLAAFAAFSVVDLGASGPPRPAATSITFLVAPSAVPQIESTQPHQIVSSETAPATTVETAIAEPEPPPSSQVETPAIEQPNVEVPKLPEAATADVRGLEAAPSPSLPTPAVSVGAFNVSRTDQTPRTHAQALAVAQLQDARAASRPTTNSSDGVQSAGFDRRPAAPATRQTVAPEGPIDVPVEILFKPTPEYTDEAKALRIQGDVILEVEFSGTGELRVLHVVRGLGHGLDESAARAAARIRFKPAQRAGRGVGVTTTVHIVFRLA